MDGTGLFICRFIGFDVPPSGCGFITVIWNEPAFVIETIKKIAEIKGLTPEETANNIFMNYKRIFE